MKAIAASALALGIGFSLHVRAEQQAAEPVPAPPASSSLSPTQHQPLPTELSGYWFVPSPAEIKASSQRSAVVNLAKGARAISDGAFAAGLPLVTGTGLDATPLADYATYYRGVALQGLARLPEADAALTTLVERKPQGYLRDWSRLKLAEVAFAREDGQRAEALLRAVGPETTRTPDEALMLLARVEESIGHRDHAVEAYRKVYFGFPLSDRVAEAKLGVDRLEAGGGVGAARTEDEQSRAERLFAARRWVDAKAAFDALAGRLSGEARAVAALRSAECEVNLGRHREGRDSLKPMLSGSSRAPEARYFYLKAVRGLGDRAGYVSLSRALVDDFPDSSWAAETLNDLASYYVIGDEDDAADKVFRELLTRFPRHRHAERAAWKVGWAAFRSRQYADVVTIFRTAAATFPRSDYRPTWLYWTARARDQMGERREAAALHSLVITDYGNSYYGRLSRRLLGASDGRAAESRADAVAPTAALTSPPTEALLRALMAAGLFDDALNEVQYAQRTAGDSPRLQATVAWIRYQQAQTLRAEERFAALRGAITMMRRAYPQFMSASGGDLPPEILRIIFPLDYWALIDKYSRAHDLDPYLIAALMAQESTFTAEIRSAANARGLMQVMPATGRQYARRLGIRPFTTASLSQAETNVRIGARYFKDLVDRFGGVHYALAGYNAGESRVVAWMKEAPGLSQDEFIDNIPFAETQAYVKRIIGTAEDYRRLYGGGLLTPNRSVGSVRAD